MTTPSIQPSVQSSRYRTHRVCDLSNQDAEQRVRVAGWVHRKRSLGSLVFLELRDATGVLQCVLTHGTAAFEAAAQLSLESVVSIAGTLVLRAEQARNPRLPSGLTQSQGGWGGPGRTPRAQRGPPRGSSTGA